MAKINLGIINPPWSPPIDKTLNRSGNKKYGVKM